MSTYPHTPRRTAGFTLIELMITVMIVGVISAYAFSSYQKSILKSGRAEAKAAITQTAAALEQWRFSRNTYAVPAVASVYTTSAYTPDTPNQLYTVTIPTDTTSTYTVTATAKSTGREYKDTDCRSFSITNAGVQTSTNSGGTASTTCW
jgi:type IV pilus assembly protein PilE